MNYVFQEDIYSIRFSGPTDFNQKLNFFTERDIHLRLLIKKISSLLLRKNKKVSNEKIVLAFKKGVAYISRIHAGETLVIRGECDEDYVILKEKEFFKKFSTE